MPDILNTFLNERKDIPKCKKCEEKIKFPPQVE
jgi:hypothetical protein